MEIKQKKVVIALCIINKQHSYCISINNYCTIVLFHSKKQLDLL